MLPIVTFVNMIYKLHLIGWTKGISIKTEIFLNTYTPVFSYFYNIKYNVYYFEQKI